MKASERAPTLEALLEEVERLMPLPQAASRVVQVTTGERFSAYDLAEVVATDTALTAKILRLANSAYYGFPRRITTVRDAVVLIGFRTVRATAIAAAMIDMLPPSRVDRFHSDLFWSHSVACALVGEAMARETGLARADEAFTVGILHDVGRLVFSQLASAAFKRALEAALAEQQPLAAAEQAELGYDHAQAGASLARRWNFPREICRAIQDHHHLEVDPQRSGLTYVVAHANALCQRHGLWCGLDPAEGAQVYSELGGAV